LKSNLKKISISLIRYQFLQMIHFNRKTFKINNNRLNFKKLFFPLKGIIDSKITSQTQVIKQMNKFLNI